MFLECLLFIYPVLFYRILLNLLELLFLFVFPEKKLLISSINATDSFRLIDKMEILDIFLIVFFKFDVVRNNRHIVVAHVFDN